MTGTKHNKYPARNIHDNNAVVDNNVIVKEVGYKYQLNKVKAKKLSEAIILYTQRLNALAIETPLNRLVTFGGNKGHWKVNITERYYHENSIFALKNNEKDNLAYIGAILKYIDILYKHSFTIGIDPKPDNFAIFKQHIVYVDACPPLIHDSSFYWTFIRHDETNEMLQAKLHRYFTLPGLMTTLIYYTLLYDISLKSALSTLLGEWINNENDKGNIFRNTLILNLIKSDLFHSTDYHDKNGYIKNLLNNIEYKDRDILRIIHLLIVSSKYYHKNHNKIIQFKKKTKKPEEFMACIRHVQTLLT